jgi:hypothetical protein
MRKLLCICAVLTAMAGACGDGSDFEADRTFREPAKTDGPVVTVQQAVWNPRWENCSLNKGPYNGYVRVVQGQLPWDGVTWGRDYNWCQLMQPNQDVSDLNWTGGHAYLYPVFDPPHRVPFPASGVHDNIGAVDFVVSRNYCVRVKLYQDWNYTGAVTDRKVCVPPWGPASQWAAVQGLSGVSSLRTRWCQWSPEEWCEF